MRCEAAGPRFSASERESLEHLPLVRVLNLSLTHSFTAGTLAVRNSIMIRTIALAGALGFALCGTALAQTVTGGAANTGVAPPTSVGGVGPGARDLGPSPITRGNEANPSNMPIPGTTPNVNIGGTPTSGPPGTGGAAGGPSLGR